jgi:hypothetical protein
LFWVISRGLRKLQVVKTKNWVSDEFLNFDGDEAIGVKTPYTLHPTP